MKRLLVASAIACSAVIAGHAQSQTLVIRGRVTATETGDALPHARVVISNDATPLPPIFTDAQGRFSSGQLTTGRYSVVVSKPGYAYTRIGGRDILAADLDVRMPRAAALSGRVVDRFGEPATGVLMSLYRDRPPEPEPQGPPSPFSASAAALKRLTTDDGGEYRFGGLAEGNYYVTATTQAVEDTTGQFVQTVTYFPGGTAATGAQGVALKPGDEKTSIDFDGISSQANAFTTGAQIVLPANQLFTPQGPVRQIPVKGTGTIRGRVTRVDGLPLAHASVTTTVPRTFQGPQGPQGRPTPGGVAVQTDEDGTYELTELPAGNYRVNAVKLGYTNMAYGQRADDESTPSFSALGNQSVGAEIQLADGQTKTRIDISLPRYSAVTGRVVDEYGDPVEGVTINLSQIKFQAGRRRLAGVQGVVGRSTDDLGRYRLYGVQPGSYIVNAAPGQVVPNQPASDLSGYAPTYFPGTTNAAEARRVPVARSLDVTGLDFVLVPTPTATISGRKLDAEGQPFGGSLMLMESQRSGAIITPAAGARVHEEDGRFEFPNVAPGDYVIQADRGKQNGSREGDFAFQFVTVNGSDVPDLLLQATRGSTISGRVIFDGDGPPPRLRSLAIIPGRADLDRTPNGGSIARGDVADDLTFQMTGVRGPRRIGIDGPPDGWGLKSVMANGVEITDVVLKFGTPDESLSDVQVILTNQLTELVTTATNARGQVTRDYTLLAFPSDREKWYAGSRGFRRVRPEPAGYADVKGLPAGDYFVAPVYGMSVLKDGVDAWQDPEFLESIAQRATRATLNDGQKLSISARVILP
jgi:Carboxypeptidase regulatory-like domain